MSKSLNRLPPELPIVSTGNKELDAAILTVQTRFNDDDKETTRAFQRLLKLKPSEAIHIAKLIVPEAWDFGQHGWDEARAKKMTPKDRALYKKEHDTAYGEQNKRKQYFAWILGQAASSPVGCARIIEVIKQDPPEEVKQLAAKALETAGSPEALKALALLLPPKPSQLGRLPLTKIAAALIRSDRKGSFDKLSPWVNPKSGHAIAVLIAADQASRPVGYSRFGFAGKKRGPDEALDPRWGDVAVSCLKAKDADLVAAALDVLLDFDVVKNEWNDSVIDVQKRFKSDTGIAERTQALLKTMPSSKQSEKLETKPTEPLPPLKRHKAPKTKYPKPQKIEALRKDIVTALKKAKLDKYESLLIAPAIHLFTQRVEENSIAIGASKIGGLPDLPASAKWPMHDGCPMSFIAQIRLEDVSQNIEGLPKKGLLSFFLDDETEEMFENCKVLLTKDTKKLTRFSTPDKFQALRAGRPARQHYAACALTLVPTLTLPSPSHPVVDENLSDAEKEAFENAAKISHPHVNQLLGYRDHGYDAENPSSACLLLRVTSDAQADMSFGDEDPVDFYVPKKALAKGEFTKVYPYVGD